MLQEMMTLKKSKMVHNFSAGPCILPNEVMLQAAQSVVEYAGTGLSIIEMSHRSKEFVAVMDNAVNLVKEVLNVPQGYEVLFLQGGASTQFLMVALNLLSEKGKAAYVETGVWAKKAIKEAKEIGNVEVIASSADKNFSYFPKSYTIPSDADYLHITSNNTIFGTQIKEFPKTDIPVVCDMSSDIFSKPVNVADFDLIYAGAQKNLGPAGATLVIIKNDILGKVERKIPTILDYRTHIKKDSMFNTPPCFSVYVCMLTLEWLKSIGGVEAMGKINEEKAETLYAEIDRNSLFEGTVTDKEDRSYMNVTFVLKDPSLSDAFLSFATERNLSGIKGHRDVGGFRASIYNALPLSSVQALVDCMRDFETKHK